MRLANPISLFLLASVGFAVAVPANAQTAEQKYNAVLEQIADKQLMITQKQEFIDRQAIQINSLKQQLKEVDAVKAAIPAMVDKMTAALEREFNADYPFSQDERSARIRALKETVASKTETIAQKYRKALGVYRIEVNYGSEVVSYRGNHPIHPTFREGDDRFERDQNGEIRVDVKSEQPILAFDGNYLRYGRTAFVYQDNDAKDTLRFDLQKRVWVPMTSNEGIQVGRGIRVAKGETAPMVIYAPVITDGAPDS